MRPLRVFVGLDPRQFASYTVLCQSIIEHASVPVSITPLVIQTLPIDRMGLTPFTYSRFLVPWLCKFHGRALFLDCDMILREDVKLLFDSSTETDKAVSVVQEIDRFEWASVMLFNCGHPDNKVLTPDYVNDPVRCKTPHMIDWTDQIGSLPSEWNHLVGYNKPREDAKLVHYTQGVPAYPETVHSEYRDEWTRAAHISMSTLPWLELMGPSVHTKKLKDGRVVPKLYREDAA